LARDYDLVLVTHNGDIPGWTARKRREGSRLKFVFELVDSYFTQTGLARRHLKGAARRVLGIDSRVSLDFMRTLAAACEAADAVICSTEEQAAIIRGFNANVHLSFDYFGDELGPAKVDFGRPGKLRIAWEGQSTTLPNLQVIRGVLNEVKNMVELHVITDPQIHRFFGRFGSYPAMRALEGIECDKHFHAWNRATFSRLVTDCDVAVIPIDQSNALWWGKPENKLVLLWQLGMPVLTSATPVYHRVMERAGVDMSCRNDGDWRRGIELLITAPPADLAGISAQCRLYAATAYSKGAFVGRFDAVLSSIGIA